MSFPHQSSAECCGCARCCHGTNVPTARCLWWYLYGSGRRARGANAAGFVVVIMSITFFQERRTERSLDAFRDLSSPRAFVVRSGKPHRIPERGLVRDDIVLLAEGDRVPADMRLVESSNLMIDESMLTGCGEGGV